MRNVFLVLLISLITINVEAQSFIEAQKVVASDRFLTSFFGNDIAISGDYAIIGEFGDGLDSTGTNAFASAGAAYIFKKDANGDWYEIKKLVANDRTDGANLGFSVHIDGDYAIVGARSDSEGLTGQAVINQAGSAYIFKKDAGGTDNWGLIKKLVASDRGVQDYFGNSVHLKGDYAIVGARLEQDDAAGQNPINAAGSAYIFKKDEGGTDNWGEVKKVVASDRGNTANFGYRVFITADYAVITAPFEEKDASGQNSALEAGAVYILGKNAGGADNWGEVQKIVASNRATSDWFGYSVDVFNDYMVIGAARKNDVTNSFTKAGAAYLFQKDANGIWNEIKILEGSSADEEDYFGESVAINENYIAIGAIREDDDMTLGGNYNDAGAVYIFKKEEGGVDNWGEFQKITNSDRDDFDYFGASVCFDGNNLMVGTTRERLDGNGMNDQFSAGAAYVFKLGFPTSTHQKINDVDLKTYPNPVQNTLTIENSEIVEQVTIYNSIGQPVCQVFDNNTQVLVDVSDLPKGLYIIEVQQKNGQSVAKQFIKL